MDTNTIIQTVLGGLVGGAFGAMLATMLIAAVFVIFLVYVYFAFAWMTIAKKLGYKDAWIAWVPIANIFLIPILAGKKWVWGFIFLVPIVNIAFFIIWTWQIYEKRGFPGALSLIPLGGIIPFLGAIAGIANLIVMGMVAWGKGKESKASKTQKKKR
jgi:hypothetical protein